MHDKYKRSEFFFRLLGRCLSPTFYFSTLFIYHLWIFGNYHDFLNKKIYEKIYCFKKYFSSCT